MTLFITVREPLRDGPNSYCEGGRESALSKLKERNITLEDTITMRDALEIVGVSDTVFVMPYVTKQSQQEAQSVLLKYMAFMFDMCRGALPILSITTYADQMKAVEKRTLGHNRPLLLAEANKLFFGMYKDSVSLIEKHALYAMVWLSSNRADNIAATHAGIALMDWGRASGRREEVADILKHKLRELIPSSQQDIWDKRA